jgi:Holliday junction resolvase
MGHARDKTPFDTVQGCHAIVQAAEAMNWDLTDLASFAKRVQSIEYGLSAEVEFAAILKWLGRCKLVHGLEQEPFSSFDVDDLKIPDLFAIFQNRNETFSTLIEVKTTDATKLKFSRDYLAALNRYAKLMNQPLLVAWKPRKLGFWVLLDPSLAKQVGNSFVIDIEIGMKNNLLSILAGDFVIVPEPGIGIVIQFKRVSDKVPTKAGYQAVFQVDHAGFKDAQGNIKSTVHPAIQAVLFATMEDSDVVTDDSVTQNFLSSGRMVHAQELLRTVVGTLNKQNEKPHWKSIAKDLGSILSCKDLRDAVGASFGIFTQYVFTQSPAVWPDFLPDLWNPLLNGEYGKKETAAP